MPEVTYATLVPVPLEKVWEFVKEMNNWAPFVTGYQSHEIKSEKNSTWTLKGDVGILSRTVRFDVNITEWIEMDRVRFTMKGLNEQVEGGGELVLERIVASPGVASSQGVGSTQNVALQQSAASTSGQRAGLLRRFLNWLSRLVFRKLHGTVERQAAPALLAGAEASKLSFTLRMEAGGPTGPLVNAMLEPALLPAAEDLGNKIAAHLEKG